MCYCRTWRKLLSFFYRINVQIMIPSSMFTMSWHLRNMWTILWEYFFWILIRAKLLATILTFRTFFILNFLWILLITTWIKSIGQVDVPLIELIFDLIYHSLKLHFVLLSLFFIINLVWVYADVTASLLEVHAHIWRKQVSKRHLSISTGFNHLDNVDLHIQSFNRLLNSYFLAISLTTETLFRQAIHKVKA